jgi:hypothetical protein
MSLPKNQNMMQKIAVLILFVVVTQNIFAQNNTTNKPLTGGSFYAELGGPGILFSMNYDKRFKKNTIGGWGGRLGLGFVGIDESIYTPTGGGGYYYSGRRKSVATFPLQVNYLFTKPNSKHAFEVGGGATFTSKKVDIFDYQNEDNSSVVYGTFSFAYRKVPLDGGFSWRIGFTPIITKGYIQESAAVSIGYNF